MLWNCSLWYLVHPVIMFNHKRDFFRHRQVFSETKFDDQLLFPALTDAVIHTTIFLFLVFKQPWSQLSLGRTPLGPALSTCLRVMSILVTIQLHCTYKRSHDIQRGQMANFCCSKYLKCRDQLWLSVLKRCPSYRGVC